MGGVLLREGLGVTLYKYMKFSCLFFKDTLWLYIMNSDWLMYYLHIFENIFYSTFNIKVNKICYYKAKLFPYLQCQ